VLLLLSVALGNGQTTHVWITRHALEHLPQGELKQVLVDNERQLLNGSMFPDGGYAFSPHHPYAETAHWEPFQDLYRDWITLEHGPPFDAEGEQHAAFLMGMASHGMADQVFDSLYMERSKVYDAEQGWASGASMDEATDVWWAHLTQPQQPPERWVPSEVFTELYAQVGIEATAEDMENGQLLLGAAIDLVGFFSSNDEMLARYEADYPWATQHLLDSVDVPGAPRCEGYLIALYWQDLWSRLNGQWGPLQVVDTLPQPGTSGLETDADTVESRLSIVFARGLGEVGPEHFSVTAEGRELAVDVWLFYGGDSHVVHLLPQQDWPENAEITVTVKPELTDRYGLSFGESWGFTVSTRQAEPRGCSHAPGSFVLLSLLAFAGCRVLKIPSAVPSKSSGRSS